MAIFRGDGGSGDSTTDAYASQVAQDANTATTKANEAAASASAAATSASNAAASESSASSDATAAATSASNASTSETNAASSESAAATSAGVASLNATSAASSASSAATSASNASTSETNAATSESNASTSETNAASSASSASTSATNAATSATAAQTAQTAAEAAQTAAEAAQEAIDGFFLGAQASNPTVDLNGNAVTAGDWYFNTGDNTTRIYDGSGWQTVNPDLIGDTTPQLGGTLDANGNNIDMGVNVITDTKVGQWDTAYGWGDHSTAGYLTSFTETDPTVPSHVKSITTTEKANWNTAYGWGDHASAGYLTTVSVDGLSDATITTPADNELLAYNSATSEWINQTPTEAGFATVATSGAYSDLSGTPTNVSTFTNDAGYLTAEADTLDSVTGRGATTTNAVTVGNLTSTGIDDNATSTAITIDSSQNVGIGTNSPNAQLEISSAAGATLRLSDTTTSTSGGDDIGTLEFYSADFSSPGASVRAYVKAVTQDVFNTAALTFATASNGISATERMRIDASGNVGIGTTSPSSMLHLRSTGSTVITLEADTDNVTETDQPRIVFKQDGGAVVGRVGYSPDASYNNDLEITNEFSSGGLVLGTNDSPRLFISSSGDVQVPNNLLVGTTTAYSSTKANVVSSLNGIYVATTRAGSGYTAAIIERTASDGTLISFYQGGTSEGSISVSGTTVSYNGGHLSRWSQSDTDDVSLLYKGTVMSNLDEMCEWDNEDNEQLNKTKVSDVEGDVNVAGVFVAKDNSDDLSDYYLAMTGDMIIRIAQGTTVQRGDLLMSAGDGTAKPQDDDIVRSKTIAKVTSTNVTCTYADGSYCVPCVLMAC